MIPKVIHYCWFGRNPLPKSAQKCIASWKKFFPDYEIKEWNEDNFDVRMMPYTAEAYDVKKFAFVSDVARFWVLYNEGGLYFDTDVEVIKPMDDIVAKGPFMGVETPAIEGFQKPTVAPGLGLGAEKGMDFYKEILDYYANQHFLDKMTGKPFADTIVTHTTKLLSEKGLVSTNEIQSTAGLWIYPKEYFNPLEDATGILNVVACTCSIHWYSKTWCDKPMWYFRITRILHRILGTTLLAKIKSYVRH